MNPSAVALEPILKQPSDEQQKVIDRIDAQRERLRVRRTERAHRLALVRREQAVAGQTQAQSNAPLWLRTAVVARRYPLGTVLLASAALLVGPRRLVRWAGIGLPLYMRLRGR